jgi:hypothetical protein
MRLKPTPATNGDPTLNVLDAPSKQKKKKGTGRGASP